MMDINPEDVSFAQICRQQAEREYTAGNLRAAYKSALLADPEGRYRYSWEDGAVREQAMRGEVPSPIAGMVGRIVNAYRYENREDITEWDRIQKDLEVGQAQLQTDNRLWIEIESYLYLKKYESVKDCDIVTAIMRRRRRQTPTQVSSRYLRT